MTVIRGFHGHTFIEPVDPLDLPLPDLEDVASVFPVLADGHTPWLPGLYGVGRKQHAELLDELVRGVLGTEAFIDLGVARLDDAGDLAVRQARLNYSPDVSRRAVRHSFHIQGMYTPFETGLDLCRCLPMGTLSPPSCGRP